MPNLTCPLSWGLLQELIVNPIKAGNTVYWFTSLNTHNKHIPRECIIYKFPHKQLLRPQKKKKNPWVALSVLLLLWAARWKRAVPHFLLICSLCHNFNLHDLWWLLDCFHNSCILHCAAPKDAQCDLLKCSFKDILFALRIDFKQLIHAGYISGQLDIFGHLQIIFFLSDPGALKLHFWP